MLPQTIQDLAVTHNDILRRIRYVFEFDDSKMIGIFGLGGQTVTRAEISDWLKKEDDPAYKACGDAEFTAFLNGLIIEKRGPKEGSQPPAEQRLNNNIVFRKLKIALDLQADQVLEIMNRAGLRLSKHELSAFFRKPGHKHYRECKDQALRSFLKGLQTSADETAGKG
jgi:uncharacterized protein YehS (DUF1456 family)